MTKGHAAWDRTVGAQARRDALLSSVLTNAEKERLHDLLRHLMLAFPDWKQKKHVAHDAADTADAREGSEAPTS